MRHTTEELLLAASVMRFAGEARNGAMPYKLSAEEQAAWLNANPLTAFVPKVMANLDKVANTIDSIRAAAK